ncbi:MAG: Homoserine kinase [Acidobacteriaceae bacterium]|nr:Homoserine kinase [Acidobacteriaceae bacterium]
MNEFHISLPATSANLGPAFDTAALALDLSLRISATKAKQYSILASGRDPEICGQVENHLILTTYREVLEAESKQSVPLALKIKNKFPIGKGCGSSAAARLAGIALAVHFGKLRWNSSRIIGEASGRERHSDNAAACWMGGVTVSRMSGDGEVQVARFLPKAKWRLLLAIPDDRLSTEKAREALPRQYSRHDVVANIQNSMLLLAALFQGDRKLLASSLEDRIHQPYRAELCPLLPALKDFPEGKGVLGAVLSGAGPSVLMFLDTGTPPERTKARVADHLEKVGMKAELVLTSIAKRGGEVSFLRRSR